MRVITWNSNGAFRKKFHLIDQMKADIFIIQECENPAESGGDYLKWAKNYQWIGSNKHKGLGVFSKLPHPIEKLDWDAERLELFLPCKISNDFNLLAVWTKQANSTNFAYIGQLWKYLQLHKNKIADGKTILCGDLNSNKCWDEWDRWWNHSDVVRELKEIALTSAYHEIKKEEQGEESSPTLYMQRNISKPYHIDYIFLPNHLINSNCTLNVGSSDEWLEHSDHMPIAVDF